MGEKDFKLLSEEDIRERLTDKFKPGDICMVMVKIIAEMDQNFRSALKEDVDKFDNVISAKIEELRQESEDDFYDLMVNAAKLLRGTLLDLAICSIIGENISFPIESSDMDYAVKFLSELQNRLKTAMEVELSTELTTAEAKNKEYYKRLVNKNLLRIEKKFDLFDLFFWENHEYDFEKLHLKLKIFEEHLSKLSEEDKKWLKEDNPGIVLGFVSGLQLTKGDKLVISINCNDSQWSKDDLSRLIREYHVFNKAKGKMADFARKEGLGNLFTWADKIYEAEKLDRAVETFKTAYNLLTPGEKEMLKEYGPNIVLGDVDGVVMNSTYVEMISIDYKNLDNFLMTLKNAIHQYRCFVDVQNELKRLAVKYGAKKIGLWDNVIYDYEDVYKNIISLKRALEQLTTQQLSLIKELNIRIILTNHENGLINAKNGCLVIAVSYKDSYDAIYKTVTEALKKADLTSALGIQLRARPDDFLEDSLLKGIEDFQIPEDLERKYDGNSKDLKIMILRNLNLRHKSFTYENILAEADLITKNYISYESVNLFSGRNVVLASNNEKFRDRKEDDYGKELTEEDYNYFEKSSGGEYRFGGERTKDVLRKEAGNFEFIRSKDDSPEHLAKSKQDILNSIRFTPPPFTFVFDGHGLGKKIILVNENLLCEKLGKDVAQRVIENGDNILTAEEIAEAILQRIVNFPEITMAKPEEKDIFVFEACESNNLIVAIFQRLSKSEANDNALPILISSAEFKQYGFSNFRNPFGGQFFSDVLDLKGLDAGSVIPTLGTVIRNQSRGVSNPTIFLPSIERNGRGYMQLGHNEYRKDESLGA